jgi:hypothetical protein
MENVQIAVVSIAIFFLLKNPWTTKCFFWPESIKMLHLQESDEMWFVVLYHFQNQFALVALLAGKK